MFPRKCICVHCSPMVRETGLESHVESYQRLKKWYLMPASFALIIMGGSRVKWSHPENVVAIENGACGSPLTKVTNFTLLTYLCY